MNADVLGVGQYPQRQEAPAKRILSNHSVLLNGNGLLDWGCRVPVAVAWLSSLEDACARRDAGHCYAGCSASRSGRA